MSQYFSPGQGIQQYEWIFTHMNMNVAIPPMPFPISNSSTKMPSSTKAMSTSKLSTKSIKTIGKDKDIFDTMKKKNE